MNDCHYYFDEDFTLTMNCEIYVSGMQYMQYPGTYKLPCGEGDYSVTLDNQIQFRPRGSNGYSHRNVTVDLECIKTVNLGFLSFNVWVGFSMG